MNNNHSQIQKIAQILAQLQTLINNNNWQNFDTIEIPFQLTQESINLWQNCFSISTLQTLAKSDPETLEAWAIALNTTLQIQLGILNQWLPLLSSSSLPPKIKEKAQQRTTEIHQIAQQKAALLQTATNLLAQEKQLHQAATELLNLRTKIEELRKLETEINNTDLVKLRLEIQQKENELIPQKQNINQLNQQKAEIENQLAYWQQKQQILSQEIASQKSNQQQQKLDILHQINQLLNLTETAKTQLDITLHTTLENLESQRQEYNQQWEKLQQTILTTKQYFQETELITAEINAHYQIDINLGKHLPINHQKINHLIQNIQNNLTELDRELKIAQSNHEHSQQKQYITFSK